MTLEERRKWIKEQWLDIASVSDAPRERSGLLVLRIAEAFRLDPILVSDFMDTVYTSGLRYESTYELIALWRDQADEARRNKRNSSDYRDAESSTFETCADELELDLKGYVDEKGQ